MSAQPERMIGVAKESIFFGDFQLSVSHSGEDYRVLGYGCVNGWFEG